MKNIDHFPSSGSTYDISITRTSADAPTIDWMTKWNPLLEDGGYKTLSSVVKEDADRLGIKTGIGLKKAAAIKKAAQEFAAKETELYAQARARLAASGALGAGAAGEPEPPVETESSAGVRAE